MTHLVLDASAGVELALRTPIGRQLEDRLPRGATVWVPEHYFVEVGAVLRRSELNDRFPAPRIQVALGRLVAAPLNRVSVAPLLREAWSPPPESHRRRRPLRDRGQAPRGGAGTTDLRLAAAPALQVETITP